MAALSFGVQLQGTNITLRVFVYQTRDEESGKGTKDLEKKESSVDDVNHKLLLGIQPFSYKLALLFSFLALNVVCLLFYKQFEFQIQELKTMNNHLSKNLHLVESDLSESRKKYSEISLLYNEVIKSFDGLKINLETIKQENKIKDFNISENEVLFNKLTSDNEDLRRVLSNAEKSLLAKEDYIKELTDALAKADLGYSKQVHSRKKKRRNPKNSGLQKPKYSFYGLTRATETPLT